MDSAREFIAHEAAPAPTPRGAPRPWWEGRPFVAAMILLSIVPLLLTLFPPLVDLPGHMGRYKVAADLASSPTLREFYDFHWRPIGNLGVDLLAVPLSKLFGVIVATKLVVMTIPALTVAGMLWVAREVHNRLPPTAAFALPLAYNHPFLYGFVNYSLSMALAFLALGLWLRLGNRDKARLRAALFVPISFIVFFAHTTGWGMMGLMIFSAEAVRQHDRGLSWWRAGLRSAYHCLPMALPLLVMLLWRTEDGGGRTGVWFEWDRKWDYVVKVVRDRWKTWDLVGAFVIYAVPLFAMLHPKLTLSRNLFFSALVLAAAYVLLPWKIFGSAYADMRLVPFVAATLVLAVRFKRRTDRRLASLIAMVAVAFFVARIAGNTASLYIADRTHREQVAVLDRLPVGAKMAAFEWAPCKNWALERDAHMPAMAIVRRDAFSNDQWRLIGASLLTIHFPQARMYEADPSQIVRNPTCRGEGWRYDAAVAHVPAVFDHLWLVHIPAHDPALTEGWREIARGGDSILYERAR